MNRWQSAVVGAFFMGFACGYAFAPSTAHAVESYSSQLARIASAAESVARTLEKAAR